MQQPVAKYRVLGDIRVRGIIVRRCPWHCVVITLKKQPRNVSLRLLGSSWKRCLGKNNTSPILTNPPWYSNFRPKRTYFRNT